MLHFMRKLSVAYPRITASQSLAYLTPKVSPLGGATMHGFHSFGAMYGVKVLSQPVKVYHQRTAALLLAERGLKTKKAAAKRFIKTGKGGLKRGKAYKGHLTSKKTSERKRRLNTKVNLVGTALKKMKTLLL